MSSLPSVSLELTRVMTVGPEVIDAEASIDEAAARLEELSVRHLPVVDGQRLVGVISDHDLRPLRAVDTSGDADSVASLMSSPPIAIRASASLGDAVDQMVANRIGALPVVDDAGMLVGIVSYVDVLRALRPLLP